MTSSGRPRDQQRRTLLAARTADVLTARQSCEVSLRELADALGESSRMLVHHFGSRDALIGAGLAHAREQLLARARGQLAERAPRNLRELVAVLREIVTDPANRPLFGLFDEVNALSQTQPDRFPGFGRSSVHDWLGPFSELLSPAGHDVGDARAEATLALAVIRGLMLDLNATGETERIDAAFAVFDALCAASGDVEAGAQRGAAE